MANITLTAAPILGGVNKTIGACKLVERDDLSMVSIAIPQKGKTKVQKGLKDGFGLAMPTPILSKSSGDTRVLQTAADQMMLLFAHSTPDAVATVRKAIGETGYLTDQTDVWVRLEISGANAHAALERLCPIDLHPSVFPVGAAARTTMEHMGAIVIRLDAEAFMLLSASSSAASFLHAVELSMTYVAD